MSIKSTTGYFAATIWRDHGLLVHGGLSSPSSLNPSNKIVLWKSESKFKRGNLIDDKGPALSHHGCCLCGNWLIVVGGWNGNSRTSKVWAFDLSTSSWSALKENPNGESRVEPPVGLSGHTVTKINNGLVCIIGREGSVRMQRRFGQMFFLHLNLESKEYFYNEAPLMPDSRSGHTAQLSPSLELFVFGGRDSGSMQVYGKPVPQAVKDRPVPMKDLKRILLEQTSLEKLKSMIGLRYHAMCILDSDSILIQGGRHFKAITGKDINANTYLWKKEGTKEGVWYLCKHSESAPASFQIPRFAHTLIADEKGLFIFGGFKSEQDTDGAQAAMLLLAETNEIK